MQILKRDDSKLKDWSLEVECTGIGYDNKNKPCYSPLKLEDSDIVKLRQKESLGENASRHWLSYGFICCQCNCFTEIPGYIIPSAIRSYCPQIAPKGSEDYSRLSKKEKELSEEL